MNSRKIETALALLLLFSAEGLQAAFEYDMPCGNLGPPLSYNPSWQHTHVSADKSSRFVHLMFLWGSGVGSLATGLYGMEFKTYHYNYDQAAAKGKGPAYVLSPAVNGYLDCDLPGCYVDSDFASVKNSLHEYNEVQIGFGVHPVYSNDVSPGRYYEATVRAVKGRGNSSLLKARNYRTVYVAPAGNFGIFLCRGTAFTLIDFQQGFRSPGCYQTNMATLSTTTC